MAMSGIVCRKPWL